MQFFVLICRTKTVIFVLNRKHYLTMIREDRLQLNDRFIRVFQLLEERGVIVKNDRGGKGMGDFAEKILGNRAYGHIVRAYLNPKDKRCIDYGQVRLLGLICLQGLLVWIPMAPTEKVILYSLLRRLLQV